MSHGYRILYGILVIKILSLGCVCTSFLCNPLVHSVVLVKVVAIGILTIDGEVWHLPLCIAKSALSVVTLVLGVGEVEVCRDLDAV